MLRIHRLVERLLWPRWLVPQSPAPVCAPAGSQQRGARQPLPHLPSLPQTAAQRRGSSVAPSASVPRAPLPLCRPQRDPLGWPEVAGVRRSLSLAAEAGPASPSQTSASTEACGNLLPIAQNLSHGKATAGTSVRPCRD